MRNTRHETGSALILAVVLTTLLAIVAVMFVMIARVDKVATSAISENKQLNLAVETIIAEISQQLVIDTPGVVDPNQEYCDYPDFRNAWLANLEPNDSGMWRHISDVDYSLGSNAWDLQAEMVADHEAIYGPNQVADADGDGVADSRWITLPNITSSKAKPIYAAIRVIDNGGMLNVNTAYKFDPNDVRGRIDGLSQTQINLAALSQRGGNGTLAVAADKLQNWRCGIEPNDLSLYEPNVVWRYDRPDGAYTPFDISDELKLRNRYIINYNKITTRIEELWENAYDGEPYVPRTINSQLTDPNGWFWYVNNSSLDVNDYDYRHIATTYNMDRIINPAGEKMFNINTATAGNKYIVRNRITEALAGLDPNFYNVNSIAAQIAANLIDFRDDDEIITVVNDDVNVPHYGFERPCIYISELTHRFKRDDFDPNIIYRSYAIELYKPYFADSDPCGWQLVINNPPRTIPIVWSGTRRFHVMRFQDPNAALAELPVPFNGDTEPNDTDANEIFDYNSSDYIAPAPQTVAFDSNTLFVGGSVISLQRPVDGNFITVDSITVPDANSNTGWLVWLLAQDGVAHSFKRDITLHKCIRRLWATRLGSWSPLTPTLGGIDPNLVVEYIDLFDADKIQAHPVNENFRNVGEIGMLLRKNAYLEGTDWIGPSDSELTARLNLADPNFQQLFKYLTVFDPTRDLIDNDNDSWLNENDSNRTPEWKVPGRININTAPWYVIAQLPWVSQRINKSVNYNIARKIVAYRDNTAGGFESIGELMRVPDSNSNYVMDYYALDFNDLIGFPDLTPGQLTPGDGDGAYGNFEERDVIFARISNLISVRSDVFTAYILVRIGRDGPQKRVIAILDRSDVYSPTDKVKIIALHPVPDPR